MDTPSGTVWLESLKKDAIIPFGSKELPFCISWGSHGLSCDTLGALLASLAALLPPFCLPLALLGTPFASSVAPFRLPVAHVTQVSDLGHFY